MKLWLEYETDMTILVVETKGARTEFRGPHDYGSGPFHGTQMEEVMDFLCGSTVSALMAGDVVHLPKPGMARHDHKWLTLALNMWQDGYAPSQSVMRG